MKPEPLYDGRNVEPAYQLRYAWTGWTSGEARFPNDVQDVISNLHEPWETDGIRVLESVCSDNRV